MGNQGFLDFLHDTRFEDLPDEVIGFSRRCLLDLIGVMIAGSGTELSRLIHDHAVDCFGAGKSSATLMLDGRSASLPGAALANGMTIDAIDAHDGYKPTKGHVGCHVFPTILAFSESLGINDGRDFLANLVVGYEIGGRAGQSLHASAPDYHTSGAWGAVTSAALGSRMLSLDAEASRHAIGIGEYHGPRSQMMRCIDHPTMLKDGSGWGAMAGISAALLAKSGFTGAPAITVENAEVGRYWADIGSRWTILEQYFKAYPVCRWAQPAAEAALTVAREQNIGHDDIQFIEVHTFHEGCRLAKREPENTEQAQYSLPYPVAAALVFGKLGPPEISGNALKDERVLRLSNSMILTEEEAYNAVFPEQRYAHVTVHLKNGTTFTSQRHAARGDPEDHLNDAEIREKFLNLAVPVVGQKRAKRIERAVDDLGNGTDVHGLLAELIPPANA